MEKERVSGTVTVSIVERPARRLIFLRYNATDYFSACEEVGCDWERFYNSIPEAFDSAAGGRLPQFLIQPARLATHFLLRFRLITTNRFRPAMRLPNCRPVPICILTVCRSMTRMIFR